MPDQQPAIRVIHVGPSPKGQGGISQIVANFLKEQGKDPEITATVVVTTYCGLRSPIGNFFAYLAAFVRVFWVCLQRPKPILHVHHTWYGSAFRKGFIVRMARLFGVPCVLAIQGGEPLYAIASGFVRRWARGTWGRCNVIVTVSDQAKAFLESVVQTPVEVMPNGVELPANPGPHSENADAPPSFLILANNMREKGCPDLMEAFDRLCEWEIPARLVLAGIDREEEVRDWIARKGHEERVDLPGWVSGEQKDRVLREASVFVLPSYREGMPVAILEAMAYGRPVIATPVGSTSVVVQHEETGLLVEPGDVSGLAAAMKRLALDPRLRRRMGEAGRELVSKEFSLEVIAQRMKRIYRTLAV